MSLSIVAPTTKPIPLKALPHASQARVKVEMGDRWILMGTSGSGKTTALKYLDSMYTRLFPTARHYIFDSKHDGDFDSFPGVVMSDRCPGSPGGNARYQVWQPIKIVPDEVEQWLWQIRHDAPAILEIDELVHLVYKRGAYSDEYTVIQKTGRSLGVGTITLTQELSKIPANAYKQAVHRLGFYLEGRYDKLIRNDMLKVEGKIEQPPDHYGLYYQHINGRGIPRYYPTIQRFLGV